MWGRLGKLSMIPRLKPYLGREEFATLFYSHPKAVTRFEIEFAHTFEANYAIAFPYGRSALWAFFKALNIENAEIIMPAYTCVVVAHAIVLSGNIPRFVDITLTDYNMDLDQVEAAINTRTRAIVATHLFGYPLNVERLDEIVRAAEARFGHKIWVIQDCAHAFGARWQGQLVCNAGDVALFGLNTAKYLTSLAGGMLTANDDDLAAKLRRYRSQVFQSTSVWRSWERRIYFLATLFAFSRWGYSLTHYLEHQTAWLDKFVRYYDEDKIDLPDNFQRQLTTVEAAIGQAQLAKLHAFEQKRRIIARRYYEALQQVRRLSIPIWQEEATYSHFVALLAPDIDRTRYIAELAKAGVDIGYKLEYCIPYMAAYVQRFGTGSYPNSLEASRRIINLPISPAFQNKDVERVITAIRRQDERLGQPVTSSLALFN